MQSLFEQSSYKNYLVGRVKAMFIADSLQRISAKNRLADYRKMLKRGEQDSLWRLHAELEKVRARSFLEYASYDYGNGYYYQSFGELHISGYRNTEERINTLALATRLKGSSVLDIGSNSGFLLASLSDVISEGRGIEVNPFLVESARLVTDYMKARNINFLNFVCL